ncbi:MAG: cysteine desulfurase family protein [Pirellulales bacterium]
MNGRIYLDFNATTPPAPEVAAAMRPYLTEDFGNPSSTHWAGIGARDAVEAARSKVAALLCCDATEIVFTSGGTESNNQVLKGTFYACCRDKARPHIITSRIEHPSILEPCRFLEGLGADVTYLPVDRFGRVDPSDVKDALQDETVLVSVMHANNETGVIQPITEIAQLARDRGVLCHTDAAQTVGKIPVDVESLGVDLLTIASHKLYGPKGVGALFVREGVELTSLLHGAGHEAGRRAGTENVASIVGLGTACEVARRWLETTDTLFLRDYFWQKLRAIFSDLVVLNGHLDERLPNTLNVSFRGLFGSNILAKLPAVAASTGSACHAGVRCLSPVLEAMGVEESIGLGAIRFSLGHTTTEQELDWVSRELERIISESDRVVGKGKASSGATKPVTH